MSTIPTLSTPGLVEGPELEALIKCLQTLHRKSRFGLATLSQILGRSVFEPTFVPGTPASPEEIAAGFVDQKRAEAYWVVLSGRGAWVIHDFVRDLDEANEQTSRVPHQQQQHVVGFEAALAVYTVHYPQDTKKWVEVPHSDPAIDSLVAAHDPHCFLMATTSRDWIRWSVWFAERERTRAGTQAGNQS
ncbi:hypothetical protein B0H14DRAFT_3459283 [Mycena olivaceomarginata]|nr:hypothetical protein B0H14DRAFT_3459283 [Mycena olivaceomarginata]